MERSIEIIKGVNRNGLFEALETSAGGLGSAEAAARLERFGLNELRVARTQLMWLKFIDNFIHLFAILLLDEVRKWIGRRYFWNKPALVVGSAIENDKEAVA